MSGVRSKPRANGKYQAWFIDCRGKIKNFIGTHNKSETLRMSQHFEDEHRQIRLGYISPPKPYQKHACRDISDVIREYLEWGAAQGGRSGMPWGKVHKRNRNVQLWWWKDKLKLKILGDLEGILSYVEKALRELSDGGLSKKTCQNYVETLKSFCRWCARRDFIRDDPLKLIVMNRITPEIKRRAMLPEEIKKLIEVVPPYRRLLYSIAMCTGLRANELKSLSLKHLDIKNGGLILEREWTKNRKPGFQPLSEALIEQLHRFALSKEPERLYNKFYHRKDSTCEAPQNPLLFVSTKLSRELDKDLIKAEIPKLTDKGKVDFHSFRVVYVTYVFEVGATVKEAQSLARHSTPDLTVNVYARVRDDRLSQLAQKVSEKILSIERVEESEFRGETTEAVQNLTSGNQKNLSLCCHKTVNQDDCESHNMREVSYLRVVK